MTRSNKTMVYAPEVIVLINTRDEVLDVTKDILSGRVTRRIDAASDLSLSLNNQGAKYTGKIRRMDRIVVFMKRLHWVQVFSGYTQVVPAFDLYPTTCTITAACTITRLQNFSWNPYTPASKNIMFQPQYVAQTPNQRDSGTGAMLYNVMEKVGNWSPSTIHVQNLPNKFLEFAKSIQATAKTPEEVQTEYLNKVASLLGITLSDALGGVGANTQGSLNSTATSLAAGGPTVVYTMNQLVAQAISVGIPGNQAAIAAAIAMAESSGKTYAIGGPNTNGSYDYGLWQINDIHRNNSYVPKGDMKQLLDPGNNAKAMFAISQGGAKWTDWSTFNYGQYRAYLTEAKQAVANFDPSTLKGGNIPTTSVGSTPGVSVKDAAVDSVTKDANGSVVGKVSSMINVGLPYVNVAPYAWGGGNASGPSLGIHDGGGPADLAGDYNKVGFDCSGLMVYMIAKSTNGRVIIPRTTSQIWSTKAGGAASIVPLAQVREGDLICTVGHIAMYVGQGKMIEAPESGLRVRIAPVRYGNLQGILRINSIAYDGPVKIDPGILGTATPNNTANDTAAVSSSEPLAEAMFRYQFLGDADSTKNALVDDASYVNVEPLFQTIKSIASSGMRSIMSAPNGDFLAFYPDNFGIMGKNPAVIIEDIELINFSLSLNYSELTTHVFSVFSPNQYSSAIDNSAWLSTQRTSVGIEDTAVMETLLNIKPSDLEFNPAGFYGKYGVKPLKIANGDIKDFTLNYFQALYTFLQKWSDQFNTRIELTFMPELYPGMRASIASQGVTVYVKEVTHEFDFSSGFSTTAIVNSPTTKEGGIPGLVIG